MPPIKYPGLNKSNIDWTDFTWNPLVGCSPCSPGCEHCYAAATAAMKPRNPKLSAEDRARYDSTVITRNGKPAWSGHVALFPDRLLAPLGRKKPARIFVGSMGDLFHEGVPDEYIDRIWAVMAACPQHTFQVLTKRPERMRDWTTFSLRRELVQLAMPGRMTDIEWPLPNVMLGVTAEDQQRADERIPVLLATPAAVRFVSIEPDLGAITLNHLHHQGITEIDAMNGTHGFNRPHGGTCAKLDWVICGGETGPGARPMNPAWARGLRDQCKAAGVSYFFKQWGEWAPCDTGSPQARLILPRGTVGPYEANCCIANWPGATLMNRVGKARAGHLLDGVEYHEYPEVKR